MLDNKLTDDSIDDGIDHLLEMESNDLPELKDNKGRLFSDTELAASNNPDRSTGDEEFEEESSSIGSDSEEEVAAILDNPVPQAEYKRLL